LTNVLGLIPARGGSKSIPGKNLVDLGGRPLIAWTIESALNSSLSKVIVSTDSIEIATVCESLGAQVPFMRPEKISTDDSLSIDVVIHALDTLQEDFDSVMLLQPTSPFRSVSDINDAIHLLFEADSVISVEAVDGMHPARMKFIDTDGYLVDPSFAEDVENMPRQQLSPLYIRSGAIYLTKIDAIRQRTFKGSKSKALIMPSSRSINIDSEFDLQIARALIAGGLL
jgi:CMP-N-acetylneuraminic acid synthetase